MLKKLINISCKHKLSYIYYNIKDRCYNSNNKDFAHYGGRKIKMCNEWYNNRLEFYTWALQNGYKEGLSIDRINVNGNYEPNNCRWIPQSEQSNNKSNSRYVTINNETHTVGEWAKKLNLSYSDAYRKLKKYF